MTTSAARARTIAATSTSVAIGVLNRTETIHRHALAVDGSLLFLPPPGSHLHPAALLNESPVVSATAVDVAPVPAADRVRGTVVFRGRPRPVERRLPAQLVAFLCSDEPAPGRSLLELRPDSITLTWHVECEDPQPVPIPPKEYAEAQPDALAGWEAPFIRHLADDHAGLLPRLARAAGLAVPDDWRVQPVIADSDGLVLRATSPAGDHRRRDVRLRFPRPAACGCDAVEGFNALLDRAERFAQTNSD